MNDRLNGIDPRLYRMQSFITPHRYQSGVDDIPFKGSGGNELYKKSFQARAHASNVTPTQMDDAVSIRSQAMSVRSRAIKNGEVQQADGATYQKLPSIRNLNPYLRSDSQRSMMSLIAFKPFQGVNPDVLLINSALGQACRDNTGNAINHG